MSGRHAPPLRTWRRPPGTLRDRALLIGTVAAGGVALAMLFVGVLILLPH